jgi:hypothetical protein
MSDLPQFGIELAPDLIGSMIPRPPHIQGQFGQRIETLDFSGQKIVDGVLDSG